PGDSLDKFVTLTGASRSTLDSIVKSLTIPVFDPVTLTWRTDVPDLEKIEWWKRISAMLSLVRRTGAAPAQLLEWARAREIRQLPTGPETLWFTWKAIDVDDIDRKPQNRRLMQESKDLVRARYDEEGWRKAARPLNDQLRERRKS